jgi:hypothetical protein
VFDFSVISFGDAVIAAHSMYKGVAIGGTLVDGSPNASGTVDRTISYIQTLDSNARFNFKGGLTLGRGADSAQNHATFGNQTWRRMPLTPLPGISRYLS